MSALELVPTTRDPALRALLERGLAQARAREAATAPEAAPEPVGPAAAPAVRPSLRSLGIASDRACVESNLARKGLWRSATTGGGELVRLLDATDQLGMVQRIDAGPPLGALAFDVIVWACTRWRELGQAGERHVPFTLEAMAADLGWGKGGGAATELAQALDTLRLATFRARVYNARIGETRIDTFGLIDRWERGERHLRHELEAAGRRSPSHHPRDRCGQAVPPACDPASCRRRDHPRRQPLRHCLARAR